MSEKRQHIHFLGIGGIGVSALAQVAQARGVVVSGSDPNADPQTNPALARLAAGGARLFREHRAKNLSYDVSLVIASAAIPADNPEIQAAQARGIPIISRADYLGQLMAAHKGPKIAVAGTHGKTTTTAMIGVMLQSAGLDPTVFVGGEVAQLGGNVRIGSEEGPFVAEACEAYDSFLSLKPDMAVLINIEADHLDHYGTFDKVLEGYSRFLMNVPGNGQVIACGDDLNVQQVVNSLPVATTFFGLAPQATIRAGSLMLDRRTEFDFIAGKGRTHIILQVPGQHNILNALAAAAVGTMLKVPAEEIGAGLGAFQGAERRQEILGDIRREEGSVLVMDDYAHHPTEIRATLNALRSTYPERRLIAIFQPHLYSRTRDFLDGFAEALASADVLLVTDIYAAREAVIPGINAEDIVNKAGALNGRITALYLPDRHDIPERLASLVCPGDLTVFLGAGDIREQGEAFVQLLLERSANR